MVLIAGWLISVVPSPSGVFSSEVRGRPRRASASGVTCSNDPSNSLTMMGSNVIVCGRLMTVFWAG